MTRLGGGRGGGPAPLDAKASKSVPAFGQRRKPSQYYPEVYVTVDKGKVISCLASENKTQRAPTLLDNDLGRFFVAMQEGRSGSFTLQPDDFAALQGIKNNTEAGETQNSTIVYMSGGRIISTLGISGSSNCIDTEILRENAIFLTSALQNQNPELDGTWRISNRDYETLFNKHTNGFQFFSEIVRSKEGVIELRENDLRLNGRYVLSEFSQRAADLWRSLYGETRLTKEKEFVLRQEDIPLLTSENEGEGDNLLKYVVLSQGEVVQCLGVQSTTDKSLSFFDTALGKLGKALSMKNNGTFLVNAHDYETLMDADIQASDRDNNETSDLQDSVIVYVEGGRIISTQLVNNSRHHIDESVLAENEEIISTFLHDDVFGGTWRISSGMYKSLCENNPHAFQFFRNVTRTEDGTITVGDAMQLSGYQDLSTYTQAPVDELIKFLHGKTRKQVAKEYTLRDEDVQVLVEYFPDKINIPTQ